MCQPALRSSRSPCAPSRPIPVRTIATDGTGVESLYDTIKRCASFQDTGVVASRKKGMIVNMLKNLVSEEIYRLIRSRMTEERFQSLVEDIYSKTLDPYSASELMIREWRDAHNA